MHHSRNNGMIAVRLSCLAESPAVVQIKPVACCQLLRHRGINQYLLKYNSWVEQIHTQALPTSLRDGNLPGGIASQDVQAPFSSKVVGMNGENLWLGISQLHSIAGIAPIVNMQSGQRANLDDAVAFL